MSSTVDVNIRRAIDKDIPAINELLSQVDMIHHVVRPDLFKIGNKYTDEQLVAKLKDESAPIFVAVDKDDNVMGYAFCVFQEHKDDNILTDIRSLYIDDLCVFEKYRGRHIGRQLYNYVREFAKSEGCYNVTLNVWNGNDSAIAFYNGLGMKVQKMGMECIL